MFSDVKNFSEVTKKVIVFTFGAFWVFASVSLYSPSDCVGCGAAEEKTQTDRIGGSHLTGLK